MIMIGKACRREKQRDRHAKQKDRDREGGRERLTMSIVPLGETIMADKIMLLKRTQWPLIDSLVRGENELH